MRWIGLFLLFVSIPAARAQDLEFRQGKKVVARYSLAQLKKTFAPGTLQLKDRHKAYRVVALQPLLKKVYGPKLYGPDTTFVFVCSDGYRSPVKSEELQKYPAFLAYASADKQPFTLENKPLGPFYLVWDTNRFPQRARDGGTPFQILAVERISWSEQYSAVLPPPKSSPQVLHGFSLFRHYCLSCHQVNGQGGSMAIDLNRPLSVTEYIREPYLYRIIDNPQKVRGRATMPPLDPTLPNRDQAIKDLIAYLKAKAQQRRSAAAKRH